MRYVMDLTKALGKKAYRFVLAKGGPFIGPRGGKWADPAHTIPWPDTKMKEPPKKESTPRSGDGGHKDADDYEDADNFKDADDYEDDDDFLDMSMAPGDLGKSGGPFSGPRGGKWADAAHTIHWDEGKHGKAPKLPDDPWRYFNQSPESQLIPISSLKPIRAREGGIDRAAKHMRAAYDTGQGKRDPIALMDNGDGTYSVLSGNSTYANAVKNGWKNMAAVVDKKLSAAAHGLQRLIDSGAISGSISDHITHTKKALKGHKAELQPFMDRLQGLAPGARITGRTKTLDSALGKVVRQPDKFKSATELHDLTGTRVITETVGEMYDAVEKLKQKYKGAFVDDRVVSPLGSMKYRSVHLVVTDDDGLTKEIQVRTEGMDVVSEWMHAIYKPQTDKQRNVVEEYKEKLTDYVAAVSDHLFSRAKGERPPDPPNPGCPSYVKATFGCPHYG